MQSVQQVRLRPQDGRREARRAAREATARDRRRGHEDHRG